MGIEAGIAFLLFGIVLGWFGRGMWEFIQKDDTPTIVYGKPGVGKSKAVRVSPLEMARTRLALQVERAMSERDAERERQLERVKGALAELGQ